ncbi:efflux RND transporter permease subunit [Bradyrhizobium erythrophlei]|uniref:Cobalt-zinc-cadmium resistance protein CzcA n=1 Tax=Bradyrhizobium erythrophlei TaxID=1437360 RepID=A0A1M7UB99_9BRAD|nr:CusA/CzcA family heavy metal efflux RND transporter [Bradyrhizobium erythrophlei]SHN80352.1 cobalt-zinc-cadmium resistance protein CzcA [Bradyrhizobium erythrophlei]
MRSSKFGGQSLLKGLLTFSLTRRPLVLLGLLGFVAAGIFAFSRLNIEAYPNPAPVMLEITAQSSGLSAEEMERYYTIPIEVGLAATPGVDVIRSTSFFGLSFVRVVFQYGVDYYFALTQTAINLQQNVTLPGNVSAQIQGTSLVGEIYRYELMGPPHFGLSNLRTVQDWILQRRLLSVPGVVQVNTWGGTTKEYDVEIDPRKLEAYGVTLQQVITALGNANVNVGGRTINIGQQSVNVRGVGLMDSGGETDLTQGYKVRDIENVMLASPSGLPIFVRDVARVSIGYVPRLGKAGRDHDEDVVAAIIIMNRTLHTNDVVKRVRSEIEKINSDGSLPPGLKLVPFYDRSTLVGVTTNTVMHNLLFGCLLIFIVQWLFLGDLRSAVIVGINVPFALFFSIIILVIRGEDANLLSVGAVDFGIIVDAAVILVENIYRNFASRPEEKQALFHQLAEKRWGDDPTGAGQPSTDMTWTDRLRLILISAMQVDRAVFFSTAIIVAAFIPLFTMQGVEGQIFGPMARTYAYALVGALLATFTVTPCLCSLLMAAHISEVETIVVRAIRRVYRPVLRFSLRRRPVTIAIGFVFLLVSGFLGSRLGSEFLPTLEEGNLWIRASMPPTLSLEAGMPFVNQMREILLKHPEVITVVSQHGRPDNGSDAAGFFNAEFFVPLKPFDEWPANYTKEKLVEELQAEFSEKFVGINFNFSQYIQDNVEEGLSGVKGANSIKIVGPDLKTLEKIARDAMEEMAKVQGITDLGVFWVLGQPNLNIRIDREKAARYGLNVSDANTVVQAALGGTVATNLLEADRQFGVAVRFAPEYRNDIDKVRNLKVGVQTANGTAFIPLSDFAAITLDTGASYIFRERNQRFVPIKFSVRGRDLAGAVEEAQERIGKNVKLPTGYRIDWAGEFEWLQQAKKRLAIILPVTFVFIMVLLYGLFNSLRHSLLALLGLPFAISGGIIGLYAFGLNFSISAAIGFISLFGVAVMSGILIIHGYYRVAASGIDPEEAMFEAVDQQMRPILMMTLSACIGLLPAALSTGIGSQVQRPLATVIVGGMLIGPIMLLVIVPALQSYFLGRETAPGPSTNPQPAE